MRRWECILFNDELELLEARLREGDGIVDQWVIVEATETFVGQPKPLMYAEHVNEFHPWNDRIIHLVAELPEGDPWAREAYQRNVMHEAIDLANEDDLILLCDADELVPATAWDALERYTREKPVILLMQAFYFTLDLMLPIMTRRSRAARRHHIEQMAAFADAVPESLGWPQIPGMGWHLSCLGGPERVARKLQSFSHTELSDPHWANEENVARLIKEGLDIDPGRGHRLVRTVPHGTRWLVTEGVKKWPWLLSGGI